MWFFVKIRLYDKKILKKDVSINKDIIIIWELLINILDKLLDGKKPPDDTSVIERFKELKDLKPVNNNDSDLKLAMKMIAQTQKGPDEQIPSMGCNIKWFK